MTEDSHSQNDIVSLDEDSVVAYLEQNPDFISRHPELATKLQPPKADKSGDVVDFQAFMMQRLKQDKSKSEQRSQSIIETSRANMDVQTRVHTAVIRMLDARSLEEFIEMLTAEVAIILDIDVITIVLEIEDGNIPNIHTLGIRMVERDIIPHLLNQKDSKLEGECTGQDIVYGGGAGLVRSQALQRLNLQPYAPDAMLAMGSRKPDLFQEGQGTELLGFMADVIERLIKRWLQS